MPFTPFHLGPALFFGLLLFRYINFPTFLIANVIVDIEPFLVLFLGLEYPLHGFFHSFLGGSVVAILLSFAMIKLDTGAQKTMKYFKLGQNLSEKSIWLAAFSGIYFHILFDSFLYTDIKPFYPFAFNPIYGLLLSPEVYLFCILLFLGGIGLYAHRLIREKRV